MLQFPKLHYGEGKMLLFDISFSCGLGARVFLKVKQNQGRKDLVEVSSEFSNKIENVIENVVRNGVEEGGYLLIFAGFFKEL